MEGGTKKEKKKVGRTKRSRQDKETEDETNGSLKTLREGNVQHVVNMLTREPTKGSLTRRKLYLGGLNLAQQDHWEYPV